MKGIGLAHGIPLDQALAESEAAAWKTRALRAEFLLAIMAECAGGTIGHVLAEVIFPVRKDEATWIDATDALKSVRHDRIRNLFWKIDR